MKISTITIILLIIASILFLTKGHLEKKRYIKTVQKYESNNKNKSY